MSLSNRQSRVLQATINMVRPAVLGAGFSVNTCFLTSRVAYDVLRALSIKTVPTPVRLQVYNPLAAEMVGRGCSDEEFRAAWKPKDEPGGPWIVDLTWGDETPNRNAPAHMVLRVQDVLVDLSLDQASRPQKDLHLLPAAFQVPSVRSFVDGDPVVFDYQPVPGTTIIYEHQPQYDGWKNTPDWNAPDYGPGYEPFIRNLASSIRKEAA